MGEGQLVELMLLLVLRHPRRLDEPRAVEHPNSSLRVSLRQPLRLEAADDQIGDARPRLLQHSAPPYAIQTPAPSRRIFWSSSDRCCMRDADSSAARVTDAVPWMSSLKKHTLPEYLCNISNALWLPKSSA